MVFRSLFLAMLPCLILSSAAGTGVVTTVRGLLHGATMGIPEGPDPAGLEGALIEFNLITDDSWLEGVFPQVGFDQIQATISGSPGGLQDGNYSATVSQHDSEGFWRSDGAGLSASDTTTGESIAIELNQAFDVDGLAFNDLYLFILRVDTGATSPVVGASVVPDNWSSSIQDLSFAAGSVFASANSFARYDVIDATFSVTVPEPSNAIWLCCLLILLQPALRRRRGHGGARGDVEG